MNISGNIVEILPSVKKMGKQVADAAL